VNKGNSSTDKWNNAALYESYVGRWSRLVAPEFISWIDRSNHSIWLDVGCGTGALSDTILKLKDPRKLTGVDPSESHIQFAKEYFISDARASFLVGDAANLPVGDNSIDVIISGLALNFVPDIKKAFAEFKRVCSNDGMICAYVWDYAGKMEMIRYFWDAARSLFNDAREKDEGVRFPVCNQNMLTQLFQSEGLSHVETTLIDVPTVFKDFGDFWKPFLSAQGPAPGYCMSLSEGSREKLRTKILKSLPVEKDGSIHLIARAIGVKGINN
jgi:ubiquinone/menaquinone biosynthesis C-methylase UbiE